MSRRKCCKDFSANTAQEKDDRRKTTSDRAQTWDLHSFAELQPHELSVPATNPLSHITLCTGRRCAVIQRPLEDLRLEDPKDSHKDVHKPVTKSQVMGLRKKVSSAVVTHSAETNEGAYSDRKSPPPTLYTQAKPLRWVMAHLSTRF